ncbi:putative nucleic acid binding protein [Senna tora]|uniref:Putative nucleic acid binding protein n=1 Tax=Senna tora TaxID=362788 RepID=A0A834WSG7_9FABA|nr:putative nucleic acid binding protein [Senna tora]
MGLLSFLAEQSESTKGRRKQKRASSSSSWDQIKNLVSCKQIQGSRVHDPSKNPKGNNPQGIGIGIDYSKLGSSCSSICSFKDVVHGNTRVVHRPDNSSPESSGSLTRRPPNNTTSSSTSTRRMHFTKLSGCYQCHMILDPSRLPIPTSTLCSCSHCGELFPKMESLELHQATRHAVSELGPEDSGRNIVEIIFKSSWVKKGRAMCMIERILKVHNTQRTIQRFEECRDAVKTRAHHTTKKNPRCAADGNELLRFHCTTISCALGARRSSSLCASLPGCTVCTIIRNGFQGSEAGGCKGVRTTASSGRAHDALQCKESRRAMLVCRVIAGRVKRVAEEDTVSAGSYDSVAGIYSNLEELVVFNPRAILPCFVVIYKVVSSC